MKSARFWKLRPTRARRVDGEEPSTGLFPPIRSYRSTCRYGLDKKSVVVPAPFGPAANGALIWDGAATIYTSNPDGSGVRTLIAGVPHAAAPVVSSDGLRVAFWGDDSPDSLFVANIDGSGVRKLAGDLWVSTNISPAWSPDGRRLLISTESGPNRRDEHLVVFDAAGGTSTTIGRDAAPGPRPPASSCEEANACR